MDDRAVAVDEVRCRVRAASAQGPEAERCHIDVVVVRTTQRVPRGQTVVVELHELETSVDAPDGRRPNLRGRAGHRRHNDENAIAPIAPASVMVDVSAIALDIARHVAIYRAIDVAMDVSIDVAAAVDVGVLAEFWATDCAAPCLRT